MIFLHIARVILFRSNRRSGDTSSQQRPQDFMDAEDGLLSNELRRNEVDSHIYCLGNIET